MNLNQVFDSALKFIETVKFQEKATELEIFALKKQALYGDYAYNLNKIDIRRDQIDENNMHHYVEAWKRKSQLSQGDAKRELIALLDKKYPNWNILMSRSINTNPNRLSSGTYPDDIALQFQKEDFVYKYAKSSNSWKKVFAEVRSFQLTLFNDQTRQKTIMGPFMVDSETKINKIQLFKDKYCVALTFNLNDNGDFTLNIGFDDTVKALEWQDLLEKIKSMNTKKTFEPQRKYSIGRQSQPLPKQGSYQETKSNPFLNQQQKPKGPQSFRQDFFNQAKEYQVLDTDKQSDQDIAAVTSDRQDLSPNRIDKKNLDINLIKQQQQQQVNVFKVNQNNELSFGGHENQKLMFNQSNQSMDVTAGFDDKSVKKSQQKYPFERTLTPLSEREFSEDEDYSSNLKKNDLNKNLFINLAEKNKGKEEVMFERRESKKGSIKFTQAPPGYEQANQFPRVAAMHSDSILSSRKGSTYSKRHKNSVLGQERAQAKIQEILNSKIPEEVYSNLDSEKNESVQSKITHEFVKDYNFLTEQRNKNPWDNAPFQLQPIIEMLYSQKSKDLLRIKEDSDTLIFNKNKLAQLDDYNKQFVKSPYCFIFKSFYHIDASVKALKKLYEEPERLKIWDPNIFQTKLLSLLQSNNSKIFNKIVKPLQQQSGSIAIQREYQLLLINYSQQVNQNLYFQVEQSIKSHQYHNLKDEELYPKVVIPLNFVIAKQKPFNKTEIKQYYCINIESLLPKLHRRSLTASVLLQPFAYCGNFCMKNTNASWNQKKGEYQNALLKQMKFHYEGMRNYVNSAEVQQEISRKSSKKSLSRKQSSLSAQRNTNDEKDPNKNKYQENQNFLSKLLTQKEEQKYSNVQQVYSGQDFNTDQDYNNINKQNQERRTSLNDQNIFNRQVVHPLPSNSDNLLNQFNQKNPIYDSKRSDLQEKRSNQEYSDTLQLGKVNTREIIRDKNSEILQSQGSNINQQNQIFSSESFKQQNKLSQVSSEGNEEKGLIHYRKSGITQRNLESNPQYQRKPSPVTQKRSQQYRQLQMQKEQQKKLQAKKSTQLVKQSENSIEQLLELSGEDQKTNINKMDYKQRATYQYQEERAIEGDNSSNNEDFLNQSMIEDGYEGNDQYDLGDEDEGDATSEDSNYDYEQELDDIVLKKGEVNTFFEDNDFKREDKHGLIYTNEALMKKQRGVLGHFIKQMGFNVLNGKSILQISLPIKVFDSKSFLEKIAMFFKMAPVYLEKAADVPQTNFAQCLQRFKLVVAFAVSSRQFAAQMRKPFNPILGETYEARVGQYKIALEQIVHHPPITYYYMWSKRHDKFKCYGSLEYRPVMGANSAGGHGYGPFIVEFEGGHKIEIWSPKTEVTGIMYGERAFNLYDTMTVKDKKNNLYCEVVFNPEKKSGLKGMFGFGGSSSSANLNEDKRVDYIEGVISTSENIDYKKNRNKLVQGADYICLVNGHWTEDLYIDGVKYWNTNEHKGFNVRPVKNPLPSDCRFREDLVHLINTDEDTGQVSSYGQSFIQKWKEILENRQRQDRKLREEAEKRRKKQGKH